MNKNMMKRLAVLVAALAVIAAMLACSAGSLISRTEPTATPTKTPKPTFTVTSTPTNTPIPTDTSTPTATWTPTPAATNTPIVYTATPTPPPTDTPVPTAAPTNTPKPTKKPSKPKPTATKAPPTSPPPTAAPSYAFQGTITGGSVNCGTTGVKGKVKTRAGANYAGVTVAVWTDGWEGAVSEPSDFGGNWNVLLGPGTRAGTWYAAVVDTSTCQTKPGGWVHTGCTHQSNIVTVTTTSHCEGEGAVQWPEIEFRQN
ncbi:MAG: hypothetical protein P8129_04450 [Anaerolineae bacterium]|jgi:hypothetical protein